MIQVNVHQVKVQLSHYLDRVAAGETVVICKHNRPVAELRPVRERPRTPRPFGLARGLVQVPPAFFEPLPDEELSAFDELPGPRSLVEPARPSVAAERPTPSRSRSARPRTTRRRRSGR